MHFLNCLQILCRDYFAKSFCEVDMENNIMVCRNQGKRIPNSKTRAPNPQLDQRSPQLNPLPQLFCILPRDLKKNEFSLSSSQKHKLDASRT